MRLAHHLSHKYGTKAPTFLKLAAVRSIARAAIGTGEPPIRAQVVYAARNEMALTMEDVLARRIGLQLYWLAPGDSRGAGSRGAASPGIRMERGGGRSRQSSEYVEEGQPHAGVSRSGSGAIAHIGELHVSEATSDKELVLERS